MNRNNVTEKSAIAQNSENNVDNNIADIDLTQTITNEK